MKTRYLLNAVLVGLGVTAVSLLILGSSTPATQAGGVINYYYVREGGMGDCLSTTTPCGSVQQAIDLAAASSDSFIQVAAGIYTENLVITQSLSVLGGWDTSFTSQNPAVYTTTIEGGGATHVVSAGGNIGFLRIDGFTLHGGLDGIHLYDETTAGDAIVGGGGVLVTRNIIHGASQQGVEIEGGTATLQGNLIATTGQEGIKITGGWATIRDSTIDGTGSHGVMAGGGDITIVDNIVHDTGGDGIEAQGTTAVVVGNIVSGCAENGIEATNVSSISIEANQVFSNAIAGIAVRQASAFTLTNNIVVDHAKNSVELGDAGTGVVYHNTLVGSGVGQQGTGITITTPSVVIVNNIVVSHSVGITRATGVTLVISNTLLWANSNNPISGTAATEQNPLFVATAAHDYHIRRDSPAVDGGIDVGVARDIDGDPRLAVPDVGADEPVWRRYLPLMMHNRNWSDRLLNPGFEGITCRPGSVPPECLDNWTHDTHYGDNYPNIFTPQGWVTWWRTGGDYGQPEVRTIPNVPPFIIIPRIRSGHYAAMLFTFYRLQDVGFYQCVINLEPGATAQFSAHAHGWSCDDSPGSQMGYSCGDPWNQTFQVGIEPNSVADPFSSNIVWSEPQISPDIYSLIGPTTAQVEEDGSVCVYLRSTTKWMYKYQDAYWDDAKLTVVAPSPQMPPPPPTP